MKWSVEEKYYTDVVISSGKLFSVVKTFNTHEILSYSTLTQLDLGEYQGTHDPNYTLRLNSVLPLSRLNGGRFELFREEPQPNSVVIRFNGAPPSEIFKEILAWINNYCEHLWSFKIELFDVNNFDLTFSFVDGTEALLYQLKWHK